MRAVVGLVLGAAVAVAGFQGAVVQSRVQSRTAGVSMGASVKELRERVGSVKNTKKITSAMKLVAAAKVRRAQEAVIRSRPFSETLERVLGGLLARLSTESLDIPLMETREAKKVALVVITGDRGLCGGYNAQMIKKAEGRIAELKAQGVDVELVTVGNKGSTYFKKRETPVCRSTRRDQPAPGCSPFLVPSAPSSDPPPPACGRSALRTRAVRARPPLRRLALRARRGQHLFHSSARPL